MKPFLSAANSFEATMKQNNVPTMILKCGALTCVPALFEASRSQARDGHLLLALSHSFAATENDDQQCDEEDHVMHVLKLPPARSVRGKLTSSRERPLPGGHFITATARYWPVSAPVSRLRRGSRSHPTGTQVRSFLSHLFAPMRAPRPHREGASGD